MNTKKCGCEKNVFACREHAHPKARHTPGPLEIGKRLVQDRIYIHSSGNKTDYGRAIVDVVNLDKDMLLGDLMNTPWGMSQTVTEVCDGIVWVSTASHGGMKLDRKQNARIPGYMRSSGGWYEEDCDWCIPGVVLNAEHSRTERAKETMRNWFPDYYEKFFNVTLLEGESYRKDETLFLERNKNNYLVLSCSPRPDGMLDVFCGRGGRLASGGYPKDVKTFIVPRCDYVVPSRFVVDENKYKAVA